MSRAAILLRFSRTLALAALIGLMFAATVEGQTTGGGTNGGGGSTGATGPRGGTQETTTSLNTSALQGAFGISSTGGQANSAYKMGTNSRNAVTTQANPLSQFYANPLSYGASGTATSGGSFGTPLYDSATGTTGARTGGTFANTSRTGAATRTGTTGARTGGTTGTTFGGTTAGRTGTTSGGTAGTAFGGTTAGRTGGTFGGTTGGFGTTTGGFGGTTGQLGRTGGLNTLGTTGGLGNTLGGRGTTLGGTNANVRRSTPYVMELSEGLDPLPVQTTAVSVVRMQPDLQATLQRSTAFATPGNIKVGTDGGTVVLQGSVTTRRERQLAEAMIRLTPGVREVRNELEVAERAPTPKPNP